MTEGMTFAPVPAGCTITHREVFAISRSRFHRASDITSTVHVQLASEHIDPLATKLHFEANEPCSSRLHGVNFLLFDANGREDSYFGNYRLAIDVSLLNSSPLPSRNRNFDRVLVSRLSTLDTGFVNAVEFTSGTIGGHDFSQAAFFEMFPCGGRQFCAGEASVGVVMPPINFMKTGSQSYRMGTRETTDGHREISAILFGNVRGRLVFSLPKEWSLTDTIEYHLRRDQRPFTILGTPQPSLDYYAWRLIFAKDLEGNPIVGISLHTLTVEALLRSDIKLSALDISRALHYQGF